MPNETGCGFPRDHRLLKPDEYRRVFNEGLRSVDDCFMVLAIPNGTRYPRLGLSVTKKNSRRAVDRNRIKRLIRESFRNHQDLLAGLDLVVVTRRGIDLVDNRACLQSLQHHWQRLAVQCAR